MPQVSAAYADLAAGGSLAPVSIRVKVITLARDDGSGQAVSDDNIATQFAVVNGALAAAGVTMEGETVVVRSTLLASRVMLSPCEVEWIGDGYCDSDEGLDCMTPETGWDGGDCLSSSPSFCSPSCDEDAVFDGACSRVCMRVPSSCQALAGDGHCDDQCNFSLAHYDGGDCCVDAAAGTCRDPSSPNRSFWSADEMKAAVAAAGAVDAGTTATAYPIYVVDFSSYTLTLGFTTFPWDPAFGLPSGGATFDAFWAFGVFPDYGMKGVTAVHELGHALGLLHTHYGVSDLLAATGVTSGTSLCRQACFEHQPSSAGGHSSMATGDLCADTRPTPVNFDCADPAGCISGHTHPVGDCACNGKSWVNTPYTNYMVGRV